MNPEFKEKMEEYVEECKNEYKDIDNKNTEDLPQGVNEVKDGLHECIDDFEEHGEKCFESCSKRKINKKCLRQCEKLQDLGGGDCDCCNYCDCDYCYGGKVKSHPTS